ncbi:MAG: hypothetical protein WD274_10695 [Acidimicrobiia bacterium]
MFNSDDVLVPEVVVEGFDPFRARVAMGGFLAGYSGKTFEAYALDLRQWAQWCFDHNLDLFEVRLRSHRTVRTVARRGRPGQVDGRSAAVHDRGVLPVLHRRTADHPFPGGACETTQGVL